MELLECNRHNSLLNRLHGDATYEITIYKSTFISQIGNITKKTSQLSHIYIMNIFTALYDIDIELLRYICSLHY